MLSIVALGRHVPRDLAVATALVVAAPLASQDPTGWFVRPDGIIGSRDASGLRLPAIGNVVVDARRNVAIVHPQTHQITVVGPDGRRVALLGGLGDGPGKFRRIDEVGRVGDTLVAFDNRGGRKRAHLYDANYKFVETRDISPVMLPGRGVPGVPLAFLRGGQMLSHGVPEADGQTPIFLSDRNGGKARELMRLRGTRMLVTVPAQPIIQIQAPFLGIYDDYPLVKVATGGGRILVVDRTAATRGGKNTFSMTMLSPSGDTLWSRKYAYEPVEITSDPVDGAVRQLAARNANALGGFAPAEAAIRKAIGPLSKFIPPVADAMMGNDGTIWVAERYGYSVLWRIYDPAGEPIAFVNIPPGKVIASIQRGWMWTVLENEGSWFVERYKVIPK